MHVVMAIGRRRTNAIVTAEEVELEMCLECQVQRRKVREEGRV